MKVQGIISKWVDPLRLMLTYLGFAEGPLLSQAVTGFQKKIYDPNQIFVQVLFQGFRKNLKPDHNRPEPRPPSPSVLYQCLHT